jgi:aminoglycoside/choline kinase family phosphotransferase
MEYKIIEKITPGGSDRVFYRCLVKEKDTYILVWDKNLQDYLRLQKHLSDRGIAVPAVIWSDEASCLLLLEDLGKTSLYQLVAGKRGKLRLYRMVIDELVKMQIDGYHDAPIKTLYDLDHIKWEQAYYKRHFLRQFCGLKPKQMKKIEGEMERLAKDVYKMIRPWRNFLMHRDFQSQNIYIKDNKVKIIDFQSARIGPLTYDLASLLRDPYVHITPDEEKKLTEYYLSLLKEKRVRMKKSEFKELYQLTGLQRNMQALGAYANLSINKNKKQFRQYIPRGLQLLQASLKKSEYRKLYECVTGPEVCAKCRL